MVRLFCSFYTLSIQSAESSFLLLLLLVGDLAHLSKTVTSCGEGVFELKNLDLFANGRLAICLRHAFTSGRRNEVHACSLRRGRHEELSYDGGRLLQGLR
jgi:hypothetical protein